MNTSAHIVEKPIQSHSAVTLVGNGRVYDTDIMDSVVRAPAVLAADGGANYLLQAGVKPQFVIGDLDSLETTAAGRDFRQNYPERIIEIADQNSTDLEKALANIRAPFIIAIGFTGKRRDHELASYNALVKYTAQPCILLSEYDVCCCLPRSSTELELPVGTRLSLFPLAPVRGTSSGLRWEIDDIDFAPQARIGTSNETKTERVWIRIDSPISPSGADLGQDSESGQLSAQASSTGLLLFLPREFLPNLIAALA